MVSVFQKSVIFILIVVIGAIIGILGSSTFQNIQDIAPFWPASAIQALAGLFFGLVGVLAATIFPVISNSLSGIPLKLVFLIMLANFIQSIIPFLVKKILKFSPYQFNKKTVIYFILYCVILPNVLSGIWMSNIKFFWVKDISVTLYPRMYVFLEWLKSNIPLGIIFGLLLLKTLAPALKNSEIYEYDKANSAEQ